MRKNILNPIDLTLHFKALPELTALKVSLADRSLCHHAPFCASARRLYHAYRLCGLFSQQDLETSICYTDTCEDYYEVHRVQVCSPQIPTRHLQFRPIPALPVRTCRSARRHAASALLRRPHADLTSAARLIVSRRGPCAHRHRAPPCACPDRLPCSRCAVDARSVRTTQK